MEKAIHITNIDNLKYFKKNRYQRIYWGVEFCQNLIPNIEDTKTIIEFIFQNNLGFTFVTPFVTERGLKRLKNIFQWLKRQQFKNFEIVVNDWGVLECLNAEFNGYFKIALGRLLVRQQRDPAIKKVLEKQLPLAVKRKDGTIRIIVHQLPSKIYQKGIRGSYINSAILHDLVSQFGVVRVELNNLLQGLELEGIKFKQSLYTPFINISTSRFCPMETRYQKIYRINVCKRECQKYYDILRNRAIPKIIYKRGNTTFYKNPVDNMCLNQQGIDRLVFQPGMPF